MRAMRSGAADYISRPFNPQQVVDAVSSAFSEIDRSVVRKQTEDQLIVRLSLLSGRERTVLDGILGGGTNKTMARDLGLSPRTVEMHRARIMAKLGVRSLSEATLLMTRAGLDLSSVLTFRPDPASTKLGPLVQRASDMGLRAVS